MKIIFYSIMICLSIHFFSCENKEQDVWKVYYFGGQSNMDGFGYNSELPDSLNGIIENAAELRKRLQDNGWSWSAENGVKSSICK
mgnify:CR=1 FL=1